MVGCFQKEKNVCLQTYKIGFLPQLLHIRDLVKFDEVMQKFESTFGAILSRNKKSKVMGIERWEGKQNWPEGVKYMKVVIEMKFFGFTICSTYQQTPKKT